MPAYKDKNNKTWFAAFNYKDWNGKIKKKFKRGFDTKEEALAFEKTFLEGLKGKPSMKFEKAVDVYLKDMEQRVKQSTFMTKQYVINDKVLPYFKNMYIKDITPADIRRWQDDLMKRGYADTYLRTIHEQLSAIFNYCVRYYELPQNPCVIAGSMGKGYAAEMEFWTLDEFNTFIKVMEDKPLCYIAFMILFWTGLRVGEMLALTIEDIDLVERTIRVNKSLQRIHGYDVITDPKTPKSNRVISIPELLSVKLDRHIRSMGGFTPDTRIVPVTRNLLQKAFKRGIRKSGVKDIHIHCLRHSHTALIASLGATPVEAAERLGHENVQTTLNIYTHVMPGRQRAISDELDKLYKKSKEDEEG